MSLVDAKAAPVTIGVLCVLILIVISLRLGVLSPELKVQENRPERIQCYSGGRLIYEGVSSAPIATVVGNARIWKFLDAADGATTHVSGDCIVKTIYVKTTITQEGK